MNKKQSISESSKIRWRDLSGWIKFWIILGILAFLEIANK